MSLFLIIFHYFSLIFWKMSLFSIKCHYFSRKWRKMSLFWQIFHYFDQKVPKMTCFWRNMAKNGQFLGYLWALTAPIEPSHGSHMLLTAPIEPEARSLMWERAQIENVAIFSTNRRFVKGLEIEDFSVALGWTKMGHFLVSCNLVKFLRNSE